MRERRLPKEVRKRLEELKQERKSYVEVKYRKAGSYYAFESTSRMDKRRERPVKISTYIGRIHEDGTFIEARHRNQDFMDYLYKFLPEPVKRELSNIRRSRPDAKVQRIEDKGFYVYDQGEAGGKMLGMISESGSFTPTAGESPTPPRIKTSEQEEKLLTALSMNARLPFSKLAEISGMSEQGAYSRVKSLERRLGIRYVIEPDLSKIRYMPFIILIKFEGERPPINELSDFFAKEPKIQFAAMSSGEYDVIAYMLDSDNFAAASTVWSLRNQGHMGGYRAVWSITLFSQTYGFMPLRDEFIDQVLSKKVWRRSGERPAPMEGELLQREFIVLREMNQNSNIDFTEIDQRHGLGRGSAQYTYHRMLEKGIIKRSTIMMTDLPIKYNYASVVAFNNVSAFDETRMKLLREVISNKGPSSRFSLVGDIGTPNGGLMVRSILDNENPTDLNEFINRNINGIQMNSMVLTDIMVGSLCYRRFDTTYTLQYPKILSRKEMEPMPSISYE